MISCLTILIDLRLVTDRRTHRQVRHRTIACYAPVTILAPQAPERNRGKHIQGRQVRGLGSEVPKRGAGWQKLKRFCIKLYRDKFLTTWM